MKKKQKAKILEMTNLTADEIFDFNFDTLDESEHTEEEDTGLFEYPDTEPAEGRVVKRSFAFLNAAQELSDYIKSLNLTHEQNDKLISLTVKQVEITETEAFWQGFVKGRTFEAREVE